MTHSVHEEQPDVPHVSSPAITKPGPPGGALILIGGNASVNGHALGAFFEASRAQRGERIVCITAASNEPIESANFWKSAFNSVGVEHALFPALARDNLRTDESVAAMIDEARGVYLGGGDQVKLVTTLTGTRTCEAIKRLHARGGVVAGTSAGAAAQSMLTMAGGEIDNEGNLVEQYLGPGLGLLGFGCIIDTHFSARKRLQRLFIVIAGNTQLFGVGIDEDTAIIVRGSVGQVIGSGGVTFVDGRDTVRFNNASALEKGRQLTLSHLRVGVVGTKYHLDLERREVDELRTAPESPHRRG
ncbi:MAG TPA: cyanophycinase [Gemmatimonadaceae bacterium]|nr:cyanophycinase [Gemmatimonadaceae bacterium]